MVSMNCGVKLPTTGTVIITPGMTCSTKRYKPAGLESFLPTIAKRGTAIAPNSQGLGIKNAEIVSTYQTVRRRRKSFSGLYSNMIGFISLKTTVAINSTTIKFLMLCGI